METDTQDLHRIDDLSEEELDDLLDYERDDEHDQDDE
jgi:hypothetical protein